MSRRRLLKGLGTVAVASVSAGLGFREALTEDTQQKYRFEWDVDSLPDPDSDGNVLEYLEDARTLELDGDELYVLPSTEMSHPEDGPEQPDSVYLSFFTQDREKVYEESLEEGEEFTMNYETDSGITSAKFVLESGWYDENGDLNATLEPV